jgi:hypothetical protein
MLRIAGWLATRCSPSSTVAIGGDKEYFRRHHDSRSTFAYELTSRLGSAAIEFGSTGRVPATTRFRSTVPVRDSMMGMCSTSPRRFAADEQNINQVVPDRPYPRVRP